MLSWTGHGTAPTASDVNISGTGTGTYGATSCGARSGETITCTATYTPNNDAVGTYTETATFSGDTNYAASSGSSSFSINGASTTTSVSSTPNPSTYAQSVTFTATINAENNFVKGRKARKPMDVTGNVTWSSNTGCQCEHGNVGSSQLGRDSDVYDLFGDTFAGGDGCGHGDLLG